MNRIIMVVDDEPVITSTLSTLLELMLEDEILTYNDPKIALEDEALKNRQVDLIISDFMMPGLDGFEFLKAARMIDPTCMTILLTGYADKNNAIKCINELDLYYYLEKPWQNDDLIKIITNAFEAQRLTSELDQKIIDLEKANKEINNLYQMLQSDYNNSLDEKTSLEKDLLKRTLDMQKILHHAGQGFLMLDTDLRVLGEYSDKCLEFFMKDIKGLYFPDLIYNDLEEKNFLGDILSDIIKADSLSRDMFIPLLPDEVLILNRPLSISFNKLDNDGIYSYFVTLTDISDKKSLEEKLLKEKQTLQMLVSAFSNAEGIKDLIADYHFFTETSLENLLSSHLKAEDIIQTIFRHIHTFKGLSSQLKLKHTSSRFHEIEDMLASTDDLDIVKTIRFEEVMKKDLALFDQYLGEQFLNLREEVVIDKDKLITLEKMITDLSSGQEMCQMLEAVHLLRFKPMESLLVSFVPFLEDLSINLNKPMKPLEISGGDLLVDLDVYRDFSKSLIHVIRNMIDHGIEMPEERLDLGKDFQGTIKIQVIEGKEQMLVIVENDGQKFDTDKIKSMAIKAGFDTANLSDDEINMLVFESGITTKKDVTAISGRGIGLSAVKYEVDRLNGKILLESNDQYTRYVFKLPYYKGLISEDKLVKILAHSLEMFIKQSDEDYVTCGKDKLVKENLNGVKIHLTGIYECVVSLFMDDMVLDQLVIEAGLETTSDLRYETLKEAINTIMGNAISLMPASGHLLEMSIPSQTNTDQVTDSTILYAIGDQNIYLGIDV